MYSHNTQFFANIKTPAFAGETLTAENLGLNGNIIPNSKIHNLRAGFFHRGGGFMPQDYRESHKFMLTVIYLHIAGAYPDTVDFQQYLMGVDFRNRQLLGLKSKSIDDTYLLHNFLLKKILAHDIAVHGPVYCR
jgi:hypothetical protein